MTHRPPQRPGLALIVRSLLELLILSIFAVTFILQPIRIPSASMQPTLRVGDFVLGDKQAFAQEGLWQHLLPPHTIHRGEIAVFRFPLAPERDLIKRIIGLPGDRIRLHDDQVLLNGQPLPEPYASYLPARFDAFRDDFPTLRQLDPNVAPSWWQQLRLTIHQNEITVPPGTYFVLGDNRNESEDSRYWGFVPAENLVAQPVLVYLSPAASDQSTLLQRLRRLPSGFHRVH